MRYSLELLTRMTSARPLPSRPPDRGSIYCSLPFMPVYASQAPHSQAGRSKLRQSAELGIGDINGEETGLSLRTTKNAFFEF